MASPTHAGCGSDGVGMPIALLSLPLVHLVGVGLATLGGATFPFQPQLLALLPSSS